jgi:hypothetical protein
MQTVLVEIGRTRQISDLAGMNTMRLNRSPEKFNSLANRLKRAGCPVQRTGSDWLDPGAFDRLDALHRLASHAQALTSPADASEARLRARHISVELATIDKIVESALVDGYWWNIAVETLPAQEWGAGRDVLARDAPEVYDTVAPAYADADLMNKAAFNQAQGGHDDYGDAVRSRLTNLRSAVADARDALNVFGRGEAAKSRRPNPTTGADNALVARIDALLEDLPRHEGYCPATIA